MLVKYVTQKSGPPIRCDGYPRFFGIRTFMRLPHVKNLSDVDFAVVDVPFDTDGTYRVGARFGPGAGNIISKRVGQAYAHRYPLFRDHALPGPTEPAPNCPRIVPGPVKTWAGLGLGLSQARLISADLSGANTPPDSSLKVAIPT